MKPDMVTIKCKCCGEMGHVTSQCPSKQKNEAQKLTHVKWSDKEDDSEDKDEDKDFFIRTINHQDTTSSQMTFTRVLFDKDSNEDE